MKSLQKSQSRSSSDLQDNKESLDVHLRNEIVARLLDRNQVLILSLCYKLFPTSPRDGFQEFALKLLKLDLDKLKEVEQKGVACLVVILKNTLFDLIRKNKTRTKHQDASMLSWVEKELPKVENELTEEEHKAIAKQRLNNRNYKVFEKLYDGDKNVEVSEELGLNEKTVATIKRRNRDKLSDLLDK